MTLTEWLQLVQVGALVLLALAVLWLVLRLTAQAVEERRVYLDDLAQLRTENEAAHFMIRRELDTVREQMQEQLHALRQQIASGVPMLGMAKSRRRAAKEPSAP